MTWCLIVCGVFAEPIWAANRTWIGGSNDWVDNADFANWSPIPDEPDADDVAIFNTSDTVNLANANAVQGLTLSGGIDLNTNDQDLTVGGLVQLSGNGTSLLVGGAASQLSAHNVTINSFGRVELAGGTLVVDEASGSGVLTINGGTLGGNGVITLADAPGLPTSLFTNNHTLEAFSQPIVVTQPLPMGTLTINGGGLFARIDLDGATEDGTVNVINNQTLDINVRLADEFNSFMAIGPNATLDIANTWTLGSGANVIVGDNFAVGIVVTPGPSTIAGGAMTQTGGTITVGDNDAVLQFDAPFTMNGGNFVNNGHVVFNADATIAAGANFTMPTGSSSITVGAARTVTVNQANFNADGNGVATNVVTVNSDGTLELNLGAGADESLTGAINLNGGRFDMNVASSLWTFAGALNVGANTGVSAVGGDDAMQLTGGTITVGENSTLLVPTATDWVSAVNAIVAAGAKLSIGGGTFKGASFTGPGELIVNGGSAVVTDTTIDVGTFDWDGDCTDCGQNHTINDGVVFTINSPSLDNLNRMDEPINLGGNGASLVVNGPVAWEMRSTFTANTAVAGVAHIGGASRMVLGNAGQLVVNGQVIVDAPMTFGTGSTTTILAVGDLRLAGGDLVSTFNRMAGGTITGFGFLAAAGNSVLQGFGTINAPIDFDGAAGLRADDGTLTISGNLADVGQIGATDDGILNFTHAWNSGVAGTVSLNGGEIAGGDLTIDNFNGVIGTGLVSARVFNNQKITASGGTLVVQTAGNDNDWDGATNTGQLNAVAGGTLEIRDNLPFNFEGSSSIGANSELFVNGFRLDWEPGSTLNLDEGARLRASQGPNFGGTLTVAAGDPAEIVTGNFFFESTSDVTITGTLRMNTLATQIDAGATFSGTGTLLVPPTSSNLRIQDGADVDVLIQNQGFFVVGDGVAAQATGLDYQQDTSGIWRVDLNGLGLNEFDRFNLDGAAQLAGTLDLDLGGGYVPDVGDTFTVLSAPGGVTGAFTSVFQPNNMPAGLLFDVVYSSNLVQLMVVNAPIFSADFDLDGDVDGDDLDEWQAGYGIGTLQTQGDADGDGDVDGRDFLIWQRQFGSAPLVAVSASTVVPEPAGWVLLLGGVVLATRHRTPRTQESRPNQRA